LNFVVGTRKVSQMCVAAQKLLRIALPFFNLPPHHSVAFTGGFFKFSPVNNLYISASVGDDSGSL